MTTYSPPYARRRTQDYGTTSLYRNNKYIACNGSVLSSTDNPWVVSLGSKITDDIVTPGFKALSEKGHIFNNPFSSVTTNVSAHIEGKFVATRIATCTGTTVKQQIATAWGDASVSEYPAGYGVIDYLALRTVAGTQAASNVASGEVMGLVELAEFKKTLRMLGNPVGGLRKFLSSVKRSKRYKKWRKLNVGKSFLDFMADEWLRYRYGVMPLFYTIVGIGEELTRDKVSTRFTARGYAEANVSHDWSLPFNWGTNDKGTIHFSNFTRVKVRAGILYEYSFSSSAQYGIRLADVPSALYELIPFSFVADWIVNLGDYISAVTPKIGVRQLATWTRVETLEAKSGNRIWDNTTMTGFTVSESRQASKTETKTSVSRTPGVAIGLAFKTQSMDLSKSIDRKHALDAIALLKQVIF